MGFRFNFVSSFLDTTGKAYCSVCKYKVVLPLAETGLTCSQFQIKVVKTCQEKDCPHRLI